MSTQITKNTFEKFYDDTYKSVLKYTICHCNNLEDVNDIIQDIKQLFSDKNCTGGALWR